MADNDSFNDKVIKEFRANGGKVGGWHEGQTLLLLHHKGVKTGTERVNPLGYRKVGDSYAIFGSAAGGPRDPQWYRNLLANPDTVAEIGAETIRVRARPAAPEERARIWAKPKAAPREIPVVILVPVS